MQPADEVTGRPQTLYDNNLIANRATYWWGDCAPMVRRIMPTVGRFWAGGPADQGARISESLTLLGVAGGPAFNSRESAACSLSDAYLLCGCPTILACFWREGGKVTNIY